MIHTPQVNSQGNENDSQSKGDINVEKKYYTVKTKHIIWINDDIGHSGQINLNLDNTVYQSFMHIFIDTTNYEKLKTEQTLRKYQRLMLSSVAHEFRNPLNAIKGNLELMQYYNFQKFDKFLKTSRNS